MPELDPSNVQFACFSTHGDTRLTLEQRAVLQALKDARGFFRTRGMTAADIAQRTELDAVNVVTPAILVLDELRVVRRTKYGKWGLANE